jgi:hypothetical protein
MLDGIVDRLNMAQIILEIQIQFPTRDLQDAHKTLFDQLIIGIEYITVESIHY